MLDSNEEKVLDVLVKRQAMPFLELASLSELPDQDIRATVNSLSQKRLVTIKNPSSVFDEVIIVTSEGFKQMNRA
jgi:hypothetical protein